MAAHPCAAPQVAEKLVFQQPAKAFSGWWSIRRQDRSGNTGL